MAQRALFYVILSLGFILQTENAVAQSYVAVRTSDGVSTLADTFGISAGSTYCLDGCWGALCEEELPPLPPPEYFDVRFIESRPGSSCLGVGTRVNLQAGAYDKPDTFWLAIQQSDTTRYPLTITWQVFIQYDCFTSITMSDTGLTGSIHVNMLTDTSYTLTDPSIKVIQFVTTTTVCPDVEDDPTDPISFRIVQNYPNPFNPSTLISYWLPKTGSVTLTFYDLLGRVVGFHEPGWQGPGLHTTRFDATGLPAGVYIARLVSGRQMTSTKLLYLR